MTTFPFSSPNNLPEISFKAGSNQELVFNVYTSGCVPVDITSATISWAMGTYGFSSVALVTKTGFPSGSPVNQFVVYLDPADTYYLYGKYIHQYSIEDTSGSVFVPSQGLINIDRLVTNLIIPDVIH